MLKKLLLAFCILQTGISVFSQDLSSYEKKELIKGTDTLRYRLLMPENYNPKTKYPLILFLHGSGERGSDNELQLVHGGAYFLQPDLRKNYPAIVVFPQCPLNDSWARYKFTSDSSGKRDFTLVTSEPETTPLKMVENLLTKLQSELAVDKKRIYVGGLSMGGMGTFEITRRDPKLFAAAFPICGATDPSTAPQVKNISWWIFHGAKDDVVPPKYSIAMAEALRKEKAEVQLTVFPLANHNSWDPTFAEPGLMPWLMSKTKSK